MASVKIHSVKFNALLNTIRTIVSMLMPLITFPYVTRVLLPEGLGKVNFATSIIGFFAIIAFLGIPTYGVREAAKVRDDKEALSKLVKELLLIQFVTTVFVYIVLFICIFTIPKFFSYRFLLIVCSTSLFFNLIGVDWLYSALEQYTYVTIRGFVVQLLSMIALFIFVKTKDDYVKYALITVCSTGGANVVNFIKSNKYIDYFKIDKLEFVKHMKPLIVLFASSIAVQVYSLLDVTILGLISGDEAVGYYSVATKVNRIVISLVYAVTGVFLPRFSYYIKNNDKEALNALLYKGLYTIFIIGLPCSVGLSLVGEPIILLLSGEEFTSAIIPMHILNPLVIVLGISSLLGGYLLSIGKEKISFYAVLSGAAVNFVLNMILIPFISVTGAAISSLTAEVLVLTIEVIYLRKTVITKPLLKNLLICIINTLIMSVFVVLAGAFIQNIVLQLIIPILTGVVVYFILLLVEKNSILYEVLHSLKAKFKRTENNE